MTRHQRLDLISAALQQTKYADETALLREFIAALRESGYPPETATAEAAAIVSASRQQKSRQGTLDAFLNEFGLSNQEGITLMCLAESLLRIPDAGTQDALIAEKILAGDWKSHRGHSDKLFVNAGVWGLMLTGRVLELDSAVRKDPDRWLARLVARSSESAIRGAVKQAMAIMGGQFVFGRSIDEALRKRRNQVPADRLYSFDMLGEGARTASAAQRYFDLYANAIARLGEAVAYDSPALRERSSISIKLSALHPRYAFAQSRRVMDELLPRVLDLAERARAAGLPLTIDAEEADRLEISLQIIEKLAHHPRLRDWNGLGLAVQAYQKRSLGVIHWLQELARSSERQFPVRLVKGAYWDTEIKHSQVEGHPDYPVFTRKAATDLAYLRCAQALFAGGDVFYPQFATHNAHTIAAVYRMAQGRAFEFQRLHGMGELLYRAARKTLIGNAPVRVYAPVGAHQDLLPYLVRRLLENGANSSFVHRFLNDTLPVETVVADPLLEVAEQLQTPAAPALPAPPDLYRDAHGAGRQNSAGFDLTDRQTVAALYQSLTREREQPRLAGALVGGEIRGSAPTPLYSPADTRTLTGEIRSSRPEDIAEAVKQATAAQPAWNARGGEERARVLENMAAALESQRDELLALIGLEAGRTLPDAISEWREAIDFCRYYAEQARQLFTTAVPLPGPTGESNTLQLEGRGVFLCISPWNFPLAIFTGQIAAALAAGNTVIAKPADQTPLIACRVAELFQAAGLPAAALHVLPGSGLDVAEPLVADERIAGVAFTGSTATAKRIQRTLAARDGAIVPLIAETGGQNAMLVDSTALLEQACDDILDSAFGSAGQRCSAARILLVQDTIADTLLPMLGEALNERQLGLPWELATDIGPVIDETARQRLETHAARMDQEAQLIAIGDKGPEHGYFFAPRIYEIASINQLQGEVFGPILHVLRWNSTTLPAALADLKATGFGLTFGVHSRLETRQQQLVTQTLAGNVYVNRSTIGAVVGVQPFGGSGLSGTGPKAGGPHYLPRFANERTICINTAAIGGNTELFR